LPRGLVDGVERVEVNSGEVGLGVLVEVVLAENLVRAGQPPIEVALCLGSPP